MAQDYKTLLKGSEEAHGMRSVRRSPNLPAQPTPLIGRDRDVAIARQMLLREDVRLLTLTGPGGSGKTRLALAVLDAVNDHFPDGASFVDLAPLTDPHLVVNAIAQTLGVRDAGALALVESVRAHLREKRLVLLLDNFEQLLGAAPEVADLLTFCSELKVLVTSRTALHLRWEHELPVLPLTVPDLRRSLSVSELAASPAVLLFVQRARAVRPDFTLTDERTRIVAEICVRLDGLPLAIELAAARLNVLTVEAVLARLDRRLQLLTTGARDQPKRHQSLQAALAWSYDLLDEPAQALLRRLAVFVGGWTLEAAAAICGQANESAADFLDRMAVLVDSNLVRQGASGGEPRYTVLETIHEYATERLSASGEAARLFDRHLTYFLALAETSEPKLKSGEQLVWLARLEADHDNLRAALSRSLGTTGMGSDPAVALRLAGALAWFWWMRGHFGEGRRWLNLALAAGNEAPAAVRAKASRDAGTMAYAQGDFDQAVALQERSLTLWRQVGDTWGIAWALGSVSVARGRLNNRDDERSIAMLEQALALFRQLEDPWHMAWCLWMLAGSRVDPLSTQRVVTPLDEPLALFRQVGDAWGTGHVLGSLAVLQMAWGNLTEAQQLLEEGTTLLQTIGDKRGLSQLKHTRGLLAQARGEIEGAAAYYFESLLLARDTGDKAAIITGLFAIGKLVRQQGKLDRAARLFGAVTAVLSLEDRAARIPSSSPGELEHELGVVSAGLGAARAIATGKEGQAMSIDQAIAYGLSVARPAESKPSSSDGNSTLLSAREHEVARLLARGLTNRQIADHLVITERTVAAHVEHILAKLGFTSRTQVALWAVEQKPLRLLPQNPGRAHPSPRRRQDA
jgi:predicted ATPase/DNA-binding CsgD family transcriptional regulator